MLYFMKVDHFERAKRLEEIPLLVKEYEEFVVADKEFWEQQQDSEVKRCWREIRELKQARTATAVNRQLNFTVKNKPHTTNYIYCIFEAYFMIKSL